MASGQAIKTFFEGMFEQGSELHRPVAQDVRVGRNSIGIAVDHGENDFPMVEVYVVHDFEGNAQGIRDPFGISQVPRPGQSPSNRPHAAMFSRDPFDLMSLIQKKSRCHRTVDPPERATKRRSVTEFDIEVSILAMVEKRSKFFDWR